MDNINNSITIFISEGKYPRDRLSNHQIDNVTDALMLLMSAYDGTENVFEKSANGYSVRNPDISVFDWVIGNYNNEVEAKRVEYPWYWHGYILLLRPLLSFFDYGQILIINTVLLGALMLFVTFYILKRIPRCIVPFVITLLLMAPTAIFNCLEFSPAVYIMLITVSILLRCGWHKRKNIIFLTFFMSGIMTAYFDFLTAPTITLTVPLVLLIIGSENEVDRFQMILLSIVSWGVGYVGMWSSKWIIAFLYGGGSFINRLLNQMAFRTSTITGGNIRISRFEVLSEVVSTLFSNSIINALVIIYALFALSLTVLHIKSINKERIITSLCLFIPVLIASFWFFILANHSVWHQFFTFRTAAPCVFGILCALDMGNNTRKYSAKRKRHKFRRYLV